MHRMVLLCNSIALLVFVVSLTHGQTTTVAPVTTAAPVITTAPPVTAITATTATTATAKASTKYYKRPGYGYGSNKYPNKYGNKYQDGYYGNNNQDDDDDQVAGYDGRGPSAYGSVNDNKQPMLSALDVWIYAADDWEQKDEGRYGGRGRDYRKPNKGPRGKRSYSQVRFPVKRLPDYRRFPAGRFPPLISILPWLPIFYDKLTFQTFIFSPTGGIYIIPPLINFYGQRFSVAQLIKWGYASLVSTGAPPPPNVDVAPLVQSPPPAGGPITTGVVGSSGARPAPSYDSKNYRFKDGVKTDFPAFKPRYSQTLDDGENRNSGPSSGRNSGSDSNYGGTRNQEVYAQGGQQRGG